MVLTRALEVGIVLVGALVAVRRPVAELGDLKDLQHLRRGVHLAPEEAVLHVQEEDVLARSAGEGGGCRVGVVPGQTGPKRLLKATIVLTNKLQGTVVC